MTSLGKEPPVLYWIFLHPNSIFGTFYPLNPKSDELLFSPYNNTAESFSKDQENRGNDHQQNKLLIVKQVLPINTSRNL